MVSRVPIPAELRDLINPRPPRPATEPLSQPDDELQLHYLADRPDLTPQIAKHLWGEWGLYFRDWSGCPDEAAVVAYLDSHYSARDQLNSCWVGTIDGRFACTAQLCTDDVQVQHPYYGVKPWITCVYVAEEFRGRGIASKLIRRILRRFREYGYPHAWLITQHMQDAYAACGFRVIETLAAYGDDHPFSVMRCDFDREFGEPIRKYTVEEAKEWYKKNGSAGKLRDTQQ